MHELSLIDSVVTAVVERLGETRVTRVRLEIGQFAAVLPDALRFSFDICTRGTTLEGAALEITEIAAQGRCRACGGTVRASDAIALCACGSADLEWLSGHELRIKDVEVA